MPEEVTDAAAQAAAASTAQVAETDAAAQAAASTTDQASTEQGVQTLEELKAELERREKRHNAAESRVKALEAKLKAEEDAKLSETDKAKKEAADEKAAREKAEKDLLDERLGTAIIRAAVLAGFADPADAVAFADRTDLLVDSKVDEAAVKSAVEAVLKAKPYLKSGAAPPAGQQTSATNGAGGKGSTITKESLSKMSAAEIAPLLENPETKEAAYAALAS